MSLPEPATQIACGDNHTVILLVSGEVVTFGKHQEGQLGRAEENEDDETWYMVPNRIEGIKIIMQQVTVSRRVMCTSYVDNNIITSLIWL